MSTAQEIIDAALREGNLIPVGTTPTTAERTEGLGRLNGFLRALFGHDLGEHLADWQVPDPLRTAPVAANYPQAHWPVETLGDPITADMGSDRWPYPPQNSRLLVKITEATTVYFPERPSAGARMQFVDLGSSAELTLDGNGRYIQTGATLAVDVGETGRIWFYRDDTANWLRIDEALALSDNSPLPAEFDDLLICGLSIRMSPRYGQEPRQGTVAMYQRMLKLLQTRYKQHGTSVGRSGDIPRGAQSFRNGLFMG